MKVNDEYTFGKEKKFEKLFKKTIPIIMKDRHNLHELNEILESLNTKETNLAYFELEDYIEQLQLIDKDFTTHISNNLKLYGIKDGIKEKVIEMLDKIIILGNPSSEYNCHGWSFGCVHNLPLSSLKINLEKELNLYKKMDEFKNSTDDSIKSLFSLKNSTLKNSIDPNFSTGSIIAYYGENEILAHTAKYMTNVKWYKYEENCYKEWYAKDRGVIKFDESGTNCTVNSYTSKLGMGYLVAHEYKDLVSLYGEDMVFYDFNEG
jgi:hypothetical protein